MQKNLLTILAGLMLSSCSYQSDISPVIKKSILSKDTVPIHKLSSISKPVPMPPKIQNINWQASFLPLLQKMLDNHVITKDNILLINTFKNATNGTLQTIKATTVLTLLIKNTNKFQIINKNQLYTARQALGLSADDSLESRSKALGLARYLNVQYVLYSTATGNVVNPWINLQFILVPTGEILWSSQGFAKY